MRLFIIFLAGLLVMAWLGTAIGHWVDHKAEAQIERTENLIEELAR